MNAVRFTPVRFLALTFALILFSLASSCSSGPKRYTASYQAPNRILFIGDSHVVGPFGRKLDQLLRTLPDTSVNTYGSCGTIARSWWTGRSTKCGALMHEENEVERVEQNAQTPQIYTKWKDFDEQIQSGILTQKPTHVIVEFGANYAGYSDSFIETDLENLFSKISDSGAKCLFVTMPDTRRADIRARQQFIIDKAKEKADGNCAFFDSTAVDPDTHAEITKYPDWDPAPPEEPFDGIHYRYKELVPQANSWAEKVFQRFRKTSGL